MQKKPGALIESGSQEEHLPSRWDSLAAEALLAAAAPTVLAPFVILMACGLGVLGLFGGAGPLSVVVAVLCLVLAPAWLDWIRQLPFRLAGSGDFDAASRAAEALAGVPGGGSAQTPRIGWLVHAAQYASVDQDHVRVQELLARVPDPDSLPPDLAFQHAYESSQVLQALGRYDEALEEEERVQRLAPGDFLGRALDLAGRRVDLLMATGDFVGALQALEEAGQGRARHRYLGYRCLHELGREEEAREALRRFGEAADGPEELRRWADMLRIGVPYLIGWADCRALGEGLEGHLGDAGAWFSTYLSRVLAPLALGEYEAVAAALDELTPSGADLAAGPALARLAALAC